jgi:hypothetical protein
LALPASLRTLRRRRLRRLLKPLPLHRRVLVSLPSGLETKADAQDYRRQFNFWWPKFVLPFLETTLAPYKIVKRSFYLRQSMLYWGIVADLRS